MSIDKIIQQTKPPEEKSWPIAYHDFVRLFWKYKGLSKEQERDRAFWAATNENLTFAYEKLDEQERKLERAYGLNKKYLDHIKEGLLIIDQEYQILDQYSLFVNELFAAGEVAGRNFIDFIYPETTSDPGDRKELGKFLSILFSNTAADTAMLDEINPLREKKLRIYGEAGTEKEIDISTTFTRILAGERVENIIFIFEDKTDLVKMQRELEMEKNRYQAEAESISVILRVGPKVFLDFVDEAMAVINDFETYAYKLDNSAVINKVFREMHSLKGSAKYMGLNHVSALAHRIEDHLATIKNGGLAPSDEYINRLTILLNDLYSEFENIEDLNDKFREFSEITITTRGKGKKDDIENFLLSLERMITNIARELNKSVRLVIKNSLQSLPFLNKIKNPIIHIIRNAVDHGIEDEYERTALNKPKIGTIELRVLKKEGHYYLEILDDGRGIDFEQVKRKAIEKNLLDEDEKGISHTRLINIIFSPNFSSRDTVSDLSGRGFGLDVVRDTMGKLKGKISVATKVRVGTKFTLKIPFLEQE